MPSPRHGLARILSKQGVCSRTQAATLIRAGRVMVNGFTARDPEHPVGPHDRVLVDGDPLDREAPAPVTVMLNKPRGYTVSRADERGRETVYDLLPPDAPWLGPVGRLDRASEGLLLLTNDTRLAEAITNPATGPAKTYHVQVRGVPGAEVLATLHAGLPCGEQGEWLAVAGVAVLRAGGRTAWLEVVLDEGRNRQIRRLLEAVGHPVERLVRVAVGGLRLATLPKGEWHLLGDSDLASIWPLQGSANGGG